MYKVISHNHNFDLFSLSEFLNQQEKDGYKLVSTDNGYYIFSYDVPTSPPPEDDRETLERAFQIIERKLSEDQLNHWGYHIIKRNVLIKPKNKGG